MKRLLEAGSHSGSDRRDTLGRRLLFAAGASAFVMVAGATAQESPRGAVEHFIGTVVRQTATVCPLASPSDQAALDSCRQALYRDSAFRNALAPVVLWGRPSPDGRMLRETNLTQFKPDVMSGLYMPMFMFLGEYEVSFDPTERPYRTRIPALFRNALDAGQYPYPFWHNAKVDRLRGANELTFWIDLKQMKITVMQFSARGHGSRLMTAPYVRPPFDGKWMWTDARDRPTPAHPSWGSCATGTRTCSSSRAYRDWPGSFARPPATNATP
jgi:hypothetical protein